MPRPCSICVHPKAATINADLLSGVTYRNVADRYGMSTTTIVRHKVHIAKALEKAKNAASKLTIAAAEKQAAKIADREVAHAETVLDRLIAYHRTIQELLTEARESKDHVGALRAVQAGLKQLELEARLLGELKDPSGSGTDITVQVVYVNANSARSEGQTPAEEEKQILDVVSQKA